MMIMDVKALLNGSPSIRHRLPSISEQRGSSTSASPDSAADTPSTMQGSTPSRRSSEIPPQRQPTRSRTPWDGDGFSLSRAQNRAGTTPSETTPAMADMPPSQSPPQSQAHTPYSGSASSPPRHRTSDSQESQTSFSSAYTGPSPIHSNEHSRMSSLTTVPETSSQLYTPPESANCESAFSESSHPSHGGAFQHQSHERHQSHQGYQRYPAHFSRETSEQNKRQLLSEIESLQNETRLILHQLPLRNRSFDNHDLPPGSLRLGWGPEQPQGPITAGRNLHPETPWHAPLHSSAPQTHRRVASAPHFQPMPSLNIPNPVFGPVPEPTPPRSSSSNREMVPYHLGLADASQPLSSHLQNATGHPSSSQELTLESPGRRRRQSSIDSTGSFEVPDHLAISLADKNKCFFMENCATKAAPRKAISHVFGRNKLCTRDILDHVWVYYCRKHYQRTRYRNGVEYPQHQIVLVRKQIQRVQKWSDMNITRGRGSVLVNWLLALRKRESDRLKELDQRAGKKRSFDEHVDNDPDSDSEGEGSGSAATHVPPWLLALVGESFDSAGMLRLVDDIQAEINAGRLTQIPDIEILPNILKDKREEEEEDNKKTHKRRSTNTNNVHRRNKVHRRTQSVNTSAMRSESMLETPSSSQPNNASNTAPSQMVPDTNSHQHQQHQNPAGVWQHMDSNSSGYTQDPHHGSGEHYGAHPTSRSDVHGHNLHGAGPLSLHERHRSMGSLQPPAPTGQGSGGPISARRIELPPMSDYDRHGPRPHQRSYSEAGPFQQQGRHHPPASFANPGYMEQEPRDPYQSHQGRPTSSGYGDEHIRLPPLHNAVGMHPSPSPFHRNPPLVGVSPATYHLRQQSSPTSTRLPTTMEATGEPETR